MDAFTDWNTRFPRGEGTDHQVGPLTPDSIFMFQSVTAPRPQPAHWGAWNWYENALQLRAHLLYVVFPDLAATWLSEGPLGLHTMRQPLAATIDDALDEWADDKDFFDRLAHDLETATGPTNHALAVELQRITAAFTDRYGRTPTWDLTVTVYPTIAEAAANLYDRDPDNITSPDGEPMTKTAWIELCQAAEADPAVSAHVEDTFRDAFEL